MSLRLSRRGAEQLVTAAAALAGAAWIAAGAPPSIAAEKRSGVERPQLAARGSPIGEGLTETAGITLMILDVEVLDKQGKPMRGLAKDDFSVTLDGEPWPLYSVDDLCACDPSEDAAIGLEPTSAAPEDRAKAESGERHSASRAGDVPAAREAGEGRGARDTSRSGDTRHTGVDGHGRDSDSARQSHTSLQALEGETSASLGAPAGGRPASPAVRYVLYFDLSQLKASGRARAFKEGRRWIQEVRKPGEEAMIAAYATHTGVREICPMTADGERLLETLSQASKDRSLYDQFPDLIEARIQECNWTVAGCLSTPFCELPTTVCISLAKEEFRNGHRSLRAFKAFLASLETTPGRKALLFFNQNGTLHPAAAYPAVTDFQAGDHLAILDQLGAEATTSRTVIHAVFTGDALGGDPLAEGAVSLGANLAESTGGTYNRDLVDLPRLVSQTRSRCACIYRLGLEPPQDEKGSRVHRALVRVRGRKLPYRWRVQFLDGMDRWLRRATAVLARPEGAQEIDLAAAVVPATFGRGRWEVSVQVALDLDALEQVPAASGGQTSWEVGALLAHAEGEDRWEMLAVSKARRGVGEDLGQELLHERRLAGLRPGVYRLAAFVRDRIANVFGGAQALVELPSPSSGRRIIGPMPLQTRRLLALPLPLLEKDSSEPAQGAVRRRGPALTTAGARVPAGEVLEMVSWVCPRRKGQDPPGVVRYISRNGEPVFRLEPPDVRPAGECFRVQDHIPTAELTAGRYTYHLRARHPRDEKDMVADAQFEVVPAAPQETAGPFPAGSSRPAPDPPPAAEGGEKERTEPVRPPGDGSSSSSPGSSPPP